MSPIALVITCLLILAQFFLPRRIGFLPLLIAACHMGNVEVIGNFTAIRLLIAAGLARAVLGGFLQWSPRNRLDQLFLLFALATVVSSIGHSSAASNPFVYRAGVAFNIFGSYLYARAYLNGPDALRRYALWLPIVLIPLAIFMTAEQRTGRNAYVALGSRKEVSNVRDGRNRAQGPFGHAILAGTAGASALPMMIFLWQRRRRRARALAGLAACTVITLACASSSPFGTFAAALGVTAFWRWRSRLRFVLTAGALGLLLLHLVMKQPVWYLMARIDLAGGSTGWHRARLIDSGLAHLNEWWLAGTDYTRHWMATGVSWSSDHVDLTNYFLHLGVIGGLPLVLILFAIIYKSLRMLLRKIAALRNVEDDTDFLLWCVGATIVAHSITFISISYFDQMFVLFYFMVGAVPGLVAAKVGRKSSTTSERSVPANSSTAHAAMTPMLSHAV